MLKIYNFFETLRYYLLTEITEAYNTRDIYNKNVKLWPTHFKKFT